MFFLFHKKRHFFIPRIESDCKAAVLSIGHSVLLYIQRKQTNNKMDGVKIKSQWQTLGQSLQTKPFCKKVLSLDTMKNVFCCGKHIFWWFDCYIVVQKGTVATGIRIAKAPVFLIGEQLRFHQSFSSHLLQKIIWYEDRSIILWCK